MAASSTANDAVDAAREITATRVFDAPRELVFQMWTDPQHVGQWWGPRGFRTTTTKLDVRPGGEWIFVMHGPDGTDYDNHIRYREIVKPSLLTYSHGPAPKFDVTVTFEEEGKKTRMTVRSVFETAEIRKQVAEDYGAVEGMNQHLDRLEEQLAIASDEFVLTRTFDAPRDLMYAVWTDAAHLSQWFGPKGFTTFFCTNDLRPGGMFHYGMRGPDGAEMWGRWIYREIVPPRKLVFLASFSDAHAGMTVHPMAPEWPRETLSIITFDEEANGKTTVTIHWTPFHANEIERKTFTAGKPSMTQGWTGTMDQLEAYLPTVQKG